MFLPIERVLMLKGVEIFAGTDDAVLLDVASVLEEATFSKGESIVRKGEIGTDLFLLAQGRVRVHDGDRELTVLGAREFFGELSAIDPEPRSASVTAIEETTLFVLSREALLELLADRHEVARAILRALCRQLRRISNRKTDPGAGRGG